MFPKVININSGEHYDYYVGRPTRFGNPYTHLQHGTTAPWPVESREDAVRLYEEWLRAQPELIEAVKKELKGKILGCHCYSTIEACHANVLLKIANEE